MNTTSLQVPAVISRPDDRSGESPFTRTVMSIMDRIEYRFCDSGEDLEDIYRLRYDAYLQAGMLKPNASRMVTDKFDDLPNSYRYGVYFEDNLVSTLRLHYVSAKYPVSPSTEVFADVLGPRLAAGETFVDPSRFAADSEWSSTLRVLPYITLRLAVVACAYFKPTYCLTAVKEEHAAFYNRIFLSEEAAPVRTYPGLTVPVSLFQSECAVNQSKTEARFPFFKSTPLEQRMLFQRPKLGEPAPLTILPSTRYFASAA